MENLVRKIVTISVVLILGMLILGTTASAGSGPTTYTSSALHYSATGWAGWSCPPGETVISGGVYESDQVTLVDPSTVFAGLAKPGVTVAGYTYPVYPHWTYPPPEEGYVAQNNSVGRTLYIKLTCQTAPPPYTPCDEWGGWKEIDRSEPYVSDDPLTLGYICEDVTTVRLDKYDPDFEVVCRGPRVRPQCTAPVSCETHEPIMVPGAFGPWHIYNNDPNTIAHDLTNVWVDPYSEQICRSEFVERYLEVANGWGGYGPPPDLLQ